MALIIALIVLTLVYCSYNSYYELRKHFKGYKQFERASFENEKHIIIFWYLYTGKT